MYRIITLLLAASVFLGCGHDSAQESKSAGDSGKEVITESSPTSADANTGAPLTTEQLQFSTKWKAASPAKRQSMAAVNKVGALFLGATKTQIKEAFGQADESGIDKFGEDVMRYELGPAVGFEDESFQAHLTLVFQDDAVSNVMGNSISFP